LDELYAPVATGINIKYMIAIANKFNMEITHFDVKTAFLNGDLEKPVYMKPPQGLKEWLKAGGNFDKENILKLEKSIYGLKVSSKCWYIKFDKVMKGMRFRNYLFNPYIYYWRSGNSFAIILVYVDDILAATNDVSKLNEIKEKLNEKFETNDLGEVQKFLGMDIFRQEK